MRQFQNPLLMTDGYKTSHHKMYPDGTTLVYSNFTPRNVNRMPIQAKQIVVFGSQYVMKYIQELYEDNFFSQPKDKVCGEAKEYLSSYLGTDYDVTHFEALHDLGFLPIRVKSLPEGTIIEQNVPFLTICNTINEFYWLPNFLETLISSLLWKPLHSASLAYGYKQIFLKNAIETDKDNTFIVNFQGHDFSFRGMQHPESAISSGLGFITSFMGTDTIPVLQASKHYYNTDNIAFSVPASEHAVITSYGKENEIDGFRRLMKQYPKGILSVVSDSFDLWQVLTKYLPELKEEILARDGKIVIRPDSGDPVDIICGYGGFNKEYEESIGNIESINNPVNKGVIELLWDVFGGTINEQGYKVLDPHIGAIYGDAITLDRLEQICLRLREKKFATTNIVLGVGSYSLGYATRDNQGGAVKATYVELEQIAEEDMSSQGGPHIGEKFIVRREIFKDPITDRGLKKSAKGLLQVYLNEQGVPALKDCCTWEEEKQGLLKTIFENGEFLIETTLTEIREKLLKLY